MSSTDDPSSSPALDRWPTLPLDFTVESVGENTKCTLYPSNAPEDQPLTAWIRADSDAFVAIDEIR